MKEWSSKVKEWWAGLSSRDKKVVTFGSSAVGIFILYAWIWSPYIDYISTMRTRIQTETKTLLWMQAANQEIRKIEGMEKNNNKAVSPVMLLSYLQKKINQAGLEKYLTQLKQASNESVEMHFQKVEFDKLVKLVTASVKEENVSISQMSVMAENSQGAVSADIVLRLG